MRSEALLAKQGVPFNVHLPAIESESEARMRDQDEVCARALALFAVAIRAEGLERPELDVFIRKYSIEPHFSPAEKAYLAAQRPSEQDGIDFLWRYEGAWVMLWALGFIPRLEMPTEICDVPGMAEIMIGNTLDSFRSKMKLRPAAEILDEADLIYRYHSASRSFRMGGHEPPGGLDAGVIQERHHALNWLIGCEGEDWDEVSTDT